MRVVLDCLPFPDPAEEARRIVRDGMNGILCSLGPELFTEWADGCPEPSVGTMQQVEALFDAERGITFCSKHFDDTETRRERYLQAMTARLHYSLEYCAIPHRPYIGIGAV